MSMTREQLLDLGPTDLLPINPNIPPSDHQRIRERINAYLQRNVSHRASLYGIAHATGAWWYLTDGGDWDYHTHTTDYDPIYTIEHILTARPQPQTTHSAWKP